MGWTMGSNNSDVHAYVKYNLNKTTHLLMVRNANSVSSIENIVRLEVPYFRPRHFWLIDEDTNI